MSVIKVIRTDENNIVNEFKKLNVNDTAIILSSTFDVNTDKLDPRVFDDGKIGFVIYDIEMLCDDMRSVQYLDGKNIPNAPFLFIKKDVPLHSQVSEHPYIYLMQAYLLGGYYFRHIAEPILKFTHGS